MKITVKLRVGSDSLARDAKKERGMERVGDHHSFSLCLLYGVYTHIQALLLPSVQYLLYNIPHFVRYEQWIESELIPKQTNAPNAR